MNSQHGKTQDLHWFGPPLWCNTLLQCGGGGLPLGADDDEQYKEEQPREGLLLAGAMNYWEEFSHLSLSLYASNRSTLCSVGGWSYL